MCLGIPGEVVEIDGTEARADFGGAEKWIRIDVVGEELSVGDYVLNHAGFAIRKIPETQVERTMELYEEAAAGGRRAERSRPDGGGPANGDGEAASTDARTGDRDRDRDCDRDRDTDGGVAGDD
jgi:hydrogenase expression/formation protein HypC